MRKYVNSTGIPLSLSVFLATDSYDHNDKVISVTTLIKPIRQTILAARVPVEASLTDIAGLVYSRVGSAVHDAIENAWLNNYHGAMKSLGYPQKLIDRVIINPEDHELKEDSLPVYLEQREYKEVRGKTVAGKFDIVIDGQVEDFKNTSVFTYIMSTNTDDYILQGSMYRWLNPKKITKDTMAIHFIFRDWQAMRAKTEANYPPSNTVVKTYKLMSVEETDMYVNNRISLLDMYWDAPENDIPRCTDEELWRKDPTWKYYKNPASKARSTKNFDNKQDAYLRLSQDGNVGEVLEVPGQVTACKYCAAFPVCSQKDDLIASGSLIL